MEREYDRHKSSSNERQARAQAWGTAALWLLWATVLILGAIWLARYYQQDIDCCGSGAQLSTHTIDFIETPSFGTCSPDDDCYVAYASQTVNSTLTLSTDSSVDIGTAHGHCITLGAHNSLPGVLQECFKVYVFDGSGDVNAGTITAHGLYFLPTNTTLAASFLTTTWSVTGGTGATYSKPNGGQVVFTTAAAQATFTGAITFNKMKRPRPLDITTFPFDQLLPEHQREVALMLTHPRDQVAWQRTCRSFYSHLPGNRLPHAETLWKRTIEATKDRQPNFKGQVTWEFFQRLLQEEILLELPISPTKIGLSEPYEILMSWPPTAGEGEKRQDAKFIWRYALTYPLRLRLKPIGRQWHRLFRQREPLDDAMKDARYHFDLTLRVCKNERLCIERFTSTDEIERFYPDPPENHDGYLWELEMGFMGENEDWSIAAWSLSELLALLDTPLGHPPLGLPEARLMAYKEDQILGKEAEDALALLSDADSGD